MSYFDLRVFRGDQKITLNAFTKYTTSLFYLVQHKFHWWLANWIPKSFLVPIWKGD